jgi:hypothetical protein
LQSVKPLTIELKWPSKGNLSLHKIERRKRNSKMTTKRIIMKEKG